MSFTYGNNRVKADALTKELESKDIQSFSVKLNQPNKDDANAFSEAASIAIREEISVVVNAIGISPNVSLQE